MSMVMPKMRHDRNTTIMTIIIASRALERAVDGVTESPALLVGVGTSKVSVAPETEIVLGGGTWKVGFPGSPGGLGGTGVVALVGAAADAVGVAAVPGGAEPFGEGAGTTDVFG